MFNRVLFVKYSIVFLLLLIASYAMNLFYASQKEAFLTKEQNSFSNTYHKKIDAVYDKVDIIFQSSIENNQRLIATLSKHSASKEASNSLEPLAVEIINSIKKFGLEELNFYDKNAQLLYNTNQLSTQALNGQKRIKDVLSNMEEYRGFVVNADSASIKYIKPIVNSNFELLGAVEFGFNMQQLGHFMTKEDGYHSEFLFPAQIIQDNIDKSLIPLYETFEYDKNYLFKKSVYSRYEKVADIYDEVFNKNAHAISSLMNQGKSLILPFEFNEQEHILILLPLAIQNETEKPAYILAYIQSDELTALNKTYLTKTLLIVFMLLLLTILSYVIHLLVLNNRRSLKYYHDLKKDIDNYVLMSETDKNGMITYVSKAFCNVSGYSKKDLIGRPQNIVRHPDMSKKLFENMWRQLHKGEVWEGEIKNIDKNGNSYWIRGIIIPIFDDEGQISGYRSIRVNITDAKQLGKVNSILKSDLSLKLNEIKSKDRLKLDESKIELMGKVLDAFANEWKKPISALTIKTVDLQTRAKEGAITQEYLLESTQELTDVIKDLSVNLNEFKYIFHNKNANERYNVYEEIEHALSTITHDNNVHLSGDSSLYSYGMANDLNKVISSLVNNALEQFKIKQIESGRVDITVVKQSEYIVINCKDNAQGIPESIMDKIFQPDFTTKLDFSSKGLSLYISKLILEKNGGSLDVQNIDGGSCFTIKLIAKDRRKERR